MFSHIFVFSFILFISVSQQSHFTNTGKCQNISSKCRYVSKSYCRTSSSIRRRCALLCGQCKTNPTTLPSVGGDCYDTGSAYYCYEKKKSGWCRYRSSVMKQNCRKTCNMCSTVVTTLKPTTKYHTAITPFFRKRSCRDAFKSSVCESYKKTGKCNPVHPEHRFMKTYCQATCNSCRICIDHISSSACANYRLSGKCKPTNKDYKFMTLYCRATCNFCGLSTTFRPSTTTKKITTTKSPSTQTTIKRSSKPTTKVTTLTTTTTTTTKLTPKKSTSPQTALTSTTTKPISETTTTTTTAITTTKKIEPPEDCGLLPAFFNLKKSNAYIHGGTDTTQTQWPWQSALFIDDVFTCGGTLIKDDWMVTSARCITTKDPSRYKIVLGTSDLKVPGAEVAVSNLFLHPSYQERNNDIALIKLKSKIPLRGYIKKACVPSGVNEVMVGSKCYVSGWGGSITSTPSKNLQFTSLKIIGNSECHLKNSKYSNITDTMLCAANKDKSICNYDRGGPLVCQRVNGRWYLEGIASWGSPQCDANDAYNVFTRVSSFSRWIDKTFESF